MKIKTKVKSGSSYAVGRVAELAAMLKVNPGVVCPGS